MTIIDYKKYERNCQEILIECNDSNIKYAMVNTSILYVLSNKTPGSQWFNPNSSLEKH